MTAKSDVTFNAEKVTAEAASIYNVLKCRLKAKSAQKLPLKLLKKCWLQ